ncbi:MAG TPA: 3',5'-nucleoside bisphosphate phosphatase [Casimicrobiaceae bacterium]|nr:3',5'-nucleoside bisphosphate phosphatase [Casimicrobiaceae bacterium]
MPRYDLHCHSTRSDGLLAPGEVVQRAASRGVDVLALTDHDELAGIPEARAAAAQCGITLVPAAELSVTWNEHTIHVVALQVDPDDAALNAGLAAVRSGRDARARRIDEALAQAGIPGALEGALRYVTSERLISRSHFARFLVERGIARDVKDVFKRFLVPGKPGYVPHAWATMGDALAWIRGAGGTAVLAHPGRYALHGSALRELIGEFRDCGGRGIEVLSSSHTAAQVAEFSGIARVHGLLASAGSDYHGPGESYLDLGDLPEMPAGLTPVWTAW